MNFKVKVGVALWNRLARENAQKVSAFDSLDDALAYARKLAPTAEITHGGGELSLYEGSGAGIEIVATIWVCIKKADNAKVSGESPRE